MRCFSHPQTTQMSVPFFFFFVLFPADAHTPFTVAAGLFLSTLALQPRDFDYVVYDREAFEAEAASRWWGARLLRRARDALAPAPRQRRGAYIKNRPPVAYF